MKIIFRSTGRDFILANHGMESPDGYRVANTRTIQPAPRLRAPLMKHFDRQNTTCTVAFGTMIEFATVKDAQAHCSRLGSELPNTGALIIENELGGTQTMDPAGLQTDEHTHMGATSVHSYVFVGGELRGK